MPDLTPRIGSKRMRPDAMTADSTSPRTDRPSPVASSRGTANGWWRRSSGALGAIAAAVVSAVALATPALAQNYCIPHPAADGCNLPRTGPHITAASISNGRLHLKLTFHKAGQFVAHLKTNPPREPYGRDWGPRPTLGKRIPIGFHSAGSGTATIALETLAPGRYGVIITPTSPVGAKPDQPLDASTVPSWVYFTERAGHVVDIRVLQP